MEVKMEDRNTLTITPENTAEMMALEGFRGAIVDLEQPRPFTPHVVKLAITKPEAK